MNSYKCPLVSVILPVYNAEKYLSSAIESILNQTYKNIELIVINDGSTDESELIIQKIVERDSRIVPISRENKGLIYTLNEGISLSTGKYIARMDADDISNENRIATQVDYLEKNKDICLVGSFFDSIDENDKFLSSITLCENDNEIKEWFFLGNPICHPSIMINKNIVGNDFLYDNDWDSAEDFELWIRLSLKYRMYNIPKPLIKYRIHSGSISSKKLKYQLTQSNKLRANYFEKKDRLLKNLIYIERIAYDRNIVLNKILKINIVILYFLNILIKQRSLKKNTVRMLLKYIIRNDHHDAKRK